MSWMKIHDHLGLYFAWLKIDCIGQVGTRFASVIKWLSNILRSNCPFKSIHKAILLSCNRRECSTWQMSGGWATSWKTDLVRAIIYQKDDFPFPCHPKQWVIKFPHSRHMLELPTSPACPTFSSARWNRVRSCLESGSQRRGRYRTAEIRHHPTTGSSKSEAGDEQGGPAKIPIYLIYS